MKKNYMVSLDKENVDLVQPHLESEGLSFSGFVNQAVAAYADVLRGLNLPKKADDLTLGQLKALANRTIEGMREKAE